MKTVASWMAVLVLLVASAAAEPVAVRMTEGYSHGFVDFYAGERRIGHGELVQFPRGKRLENRLVVAFDDGSLFDEKVVFTQERVFRLRAYHLVQRGPSFPEATDVAFDDSGTYRVRIQRPGEAEEKADGTVEVPADVYNGLTSTLLKNLRPGETGEIHHLAFTPRPRLLTGTLIPEGEDRFRVGTAERVATRYRIALHVAGLAGIAARLIGKDPPDVRYWIAKGASPTFLRFEGPMFVDGPVWRAELAGPQWEESSPRPTSRSPRPK